MKGKTFALSFLPIGKKGRKEKGLRYNKDKLLIFLWRKRIKEKITVVLCEVEKT